MKKLISLIIFILLVSSCNKDNNYIKEKLLGRWSDASDGYNNDIHFYKDSIVINTSFCRKSVGTWKTINSKIYANFPDDANNPDWNENVIWNYTLSELKDSLFIKLENDTINHLLLKVQNDWAFYNKIIGMNITLPEIDKKLSKRDSIDYSPNLFIDNKNDTLKFIVTPKFKHPYKDNLIKSILYNLNFSKDSKIVNIIADKNVTEAKIDSIKKIIKNIDIYKINFFRVYKNKNEKYGYQNPNCLIDESWNWWGLYED